MARFHGSEAIEKIARQLFLTIDRSISTLIARTRARQLGPVTIAQPRQLPAPRSDGR
jgi:hypothetical protein